MSLCWTGGLRDVRRKDGPDTIGSQVVYLGGAEWVGNHVSPCLDRTGLSPSISVSLILFVSDIWWKNRTCLRLKRGLDAKT